MWSKSYSPYYLAVFLFITVNLTTSHAKPPQPIVGGRPVSPGEYPFVVTIHSEGSHLCGGSIIGPRHILTAAHCVANLQNHAYTGMLVKSGTISCRSGGQSHRIRIARYHRGYMKNDPASANDLAIIELAAPITFNNYQTYIQISSSPVPSGVRATAIGWGFRSVNSPIINPSLEQVTLTTIESSECQQYLPFRLWTHQICAVGPPGYGVCAGDSGGPLIYNNQLIGIVSYGIPCAVGKPDVFTSTYHYRDWISEVLRK